MPFLFTPIKIKPCNILNEYFFYLSPLERKTYTVILLVSKSTQLTSIGGSYKSKNLESTPMRNGNGAWSTSANPKGQRGI
jgi:hypothetical protein